MPFHRSWGYPRAAMAKNRRDRSAPLDVPDRGVGADVRRRRRDLALTQEALAELAGCSSRFVRALETGKGTVRLDKVTAVLDALGLELRLVRRTVP